MRVLKQLFNITPQLLVIIRPVQCLTAAGAVIAFASIATGQLTLTPTVIAAAIAMALLIFASSIYHCAFQKHDQPFTRRMNDYIPQPNPRLLAPIASMAFIASVGISINFLPIGATATIVAAGGLVATYTWFRGREPLNPLIALLCTAPVLMGWLASGTPLSGWTYSFMAFAYLFYLMRENAKDGQESGVAHEHIMANLEANEAAGFGGTMILYTMLPTIVTVIIAFSRPGFDPNSSSSAFLIILILFGMGGIMGFFYSTPQLKKGFFPKPQALMTAFTWVYLFICTQTMPMVS